MESESRPPEGPAASPGDVTRLLERVSSGDEAAEAELYRVVERGLRRQAQQMVRSGSASTMMATQLIDDAFMKVVRSEASWAGRQHFQLVAARAMRQLVVDSVRHKNAQKRGAGAEREELSQIVMTFENDALDVLALDEALNELVEFDPQMAEAVQLRYFGGLNAGEVAEALGVSERQMRRRWPMTLDWLYQRVR